MNNLYWHKPLVTRADREWLNGHKSFVLWFTGLSGAGKSTLAHYLEAVLFERHCRTYVFDGDNIRHGLCSDLGFSPEDRSENIRRVGELAKLFVDAGIIAMVALISPFRRDRERVRQLFRQGDGDFIEIYCDAPLEVCERRDTKGLYAKARRGEIKEFTGISSPYEPPENPELVVPTGRDPLEVCAAMVLDYLEQRHLIPKAPPMKRAKNLW